MGLLDSLKSQYLNVQKWNLECFTFEIGATWSIGEIVMCLPMMLFFLLIGYAG